MQRVSEDESMRTGHEIYAGMQQYMTMRQVERVVGRVRHAAPRRSEEDDGSNSSDEEIDGHATTGEERPLEQASEESPEEKGCRKDWRGMKEGRGEG